MARPRRKPDSDRLLGPNDRTLHRCAGSVLRLSSVRRIPAPSSTPRFPRRTHSESLAVASSAARPTGPGGARRTFRKLSLLSTLLDGLGLTEAEFCTVLAQLNHVPQPGNVLHTPTRMPRRAQHTARLAKRPTMRRAPSKPLAVGRPIC